MTGRPGDRTTEMNGGSTASYLVRTPRVPLFMFIFTGLEVNGFRQVIFGADYSAL